MYQPLSWALTIDQPQSHLQTRISLHLFIPCILQFLARKSLLLFIDFAFLIKWFFSVFVCPKFERKCKLQPKVSSLPSLRVPYTFLWLLLCMKHQWGFTFFVIGDSIFLHPQETAFWFFCDPWNIHLLKVWFVN